MYASTCRYIHPFHSFVSLNLWYLFTVLTDCLSTLSTPWVVHKKGKLNRNSKLKQVISDKRYPKANMQRPVVEGNQNQAPEEANASAKNDWLNLISQSTHRKLGIQSHSEKWRDEQWWYTNRSGIPRFKSPLCRGNLPGVLDIYLPEAGKSLFLSPNPPLSRKWNARGKITGKWTLFTML